MNFWDYEIKILFILWSTTVWTPKWRSTKSQTTFDNSHLENEPSALHNLTSYFKDVAYIICNNKHKKWGRVKRERTPGIALDDSRLSRSFKSNSPVKKKVYSEQPCSLVRTARRSSSSKAQRPGIYVWKEDEEKQWQM